MLLISRVN